MYKGLETGLGTAQVDKTCHIRPCCASPERRRQLFLVKGPVRTRQLQTLLCCLPLSFLSAKAQKRALSCLQLGGVKGRDERFTSDHSADSREKRLPHGLPLACRRSVGSLAGTYKPVPEFSVSRQVKARLYQWSHSCFAGMKRQHGHDYSELWWTFVELVSTAIWQSFVPGQVIDAETMMPGHLMSQHIWLIAPEKYISIYINRAYTRQRECVSR